MVLSFVAGLFIGALLGTIVMGLCAASGRNRDDE